MGTRDDRPFDLILYGATSFVGRILARRLVERQGTTGPLRWAIAGRDAAKLERIAVEVGADVERIIADAADPDALADLAGSTRVVVSTVGPYALYGSDLVAAVAAAGTDYCDLTGEPQWMRKMIDQHQATADYYRAWHLGTAKSVVHFARIIKAKSPDKLVGAFYGSYGCTNLIDGGTAGGVLHILDSGVVDFLAAPGVYENRQPGGFTGQREMNDSFRLRNTMFIVEEDTRTHFENRHYQNLIEMFDMTDTYGIMKRDFGRNICEDLQAWWFDQHVGGGRYKHPDIYALIARQQEIARFAYSLDRRKGSEIAFIYDEESIHVTAQWASLDSIEMTRNYEIAHIGAPVDQYYHNDTANPAMPAYKLYVFFNVYSLTDQERRDILAKVKRDHAVALWLYAPGVINPDREQQFSHEYLSDLTGMRSAMLLENWSSKFKINGDAHPAFAELDKGQIFGALDRRMPNNVRPGVRSRETSSYPVFYMDDPSALTAARFLGNRLPALSVKAMDGWTSVYCGAKYVRAELYRAVARYAGCHIYSDDGDCLYASRNFVTVHAATSGEKCLRLPVVCSPYELYERQTYGEDTREIRFSMLRGETKMFSLVGKD